MEKSDLKYIQKLELRITKLEKEVFKKKSSSKPDPENDESITALKDLINEGFFDELRKQKDIIKKLKTNATFQKNVKYSASLAILVKEKLLQRKQKEHQWVYAKNG